MTHSYVIVIVDKDGKPTYSQAYPTVYEMRAEEQNRIADTHPDYTVKTYMVTEINSTPGKMKEE